MLNTFESLSHGGSASSLESSSCLLLTRAAILFNLAAREAPPAPDHSGKARRAASKAASTSFALASGSVAITSSVAASMTSKVEVPVDAHHVLSTKSGEPAGGSDVGRRVA
jgi:hypothetical protein